MGGAYLPPPRVWPPLEVKAHWDQTMEAECPPWSQVKSQQGSLPGWGQELLSQSGSYTFWDPGQFYW